MTPIFEPTWTCRIGAVTHTGQGLLPKELHALRGEIDEFIVPCGTIGVKVSPVQKTMWVGGGHYFTGVTGDKWTLLWYRTMEFNLNGSISQSIPECKCYALGLYCDGNPEIGVRLFEDGRMLIGL